MSSTAKSVIYRVPLFPFLIAVSPVFSFFALNNLGLNTVDLIRPTLVHVVLAFLSFAVSLKILGTYRGAAVLSCIPIVSVVLFGHASIWIYSILGSNIPDVYFLSVWLALALLIFYLLARVLRKSNSTFFELTAILNTFGITLVFLSLLPLILSRLPTDAGSSEINVQKLFAEPARHEWLPTEFSVKQMKEPPDFYFIIMDAYARGDVLESRFGLDNSRFLEWLDSNGFFVASSSHSNYAWTHLSLGSTLNAECLQSLVPEEWKANLPEQVHDRYLFVKKLIKSNFINDSRVHRFFSSLGYRIVSSGPGHPTVKKHHRFLAEALLGPLNEIEKALVVNSVLRPVFSETNSEAIKRWRILKYDQVVGALESLVFDAHGQSPKFVFHHILSPHKPFGFDSNGNPVSRHPFYDSTDWMDKEPKSGYKDWYKSNYPKNVAGLNQHLKSAIQDIMETSGGNAIIILQSDHGSALGLNPLSPAQSDIVERFGNLNAIFLPAEYPRDGLTDTMSSINTFPVVLNNIFNLQLPLHENRAYYSYGDLEFTDVTEQVHR